uniref:Putative ovule protein n=1 Tax=Solanum chacoense TaxID=4108 RepID=A0A0V0GRD9_SOLCH
MQSAKEDGQEDESIDVLFSLSCPPCKISQTSWGLILSNMPSDPITTYQSSVDKRLQPVTSGSAITPYLFKRISPIDRETANMPLTRGTPMTRTAPPACLSNF